MDKINFDNATVLVTGGTGSWGHELVRQLLEKYPDVREVRVYSRGEHKQVEMKREFGNDPRIRFVIGDVRDKNILNYAMRDVDIAFHLAALKHVPVCEDNTWEAVLTNIYGTQNIIEAAINNGVKKVVDVSTDKAVDPFNLYGVTKACGEKLMINANFNYNFRNSGRNFPSFICIRGGNVIGTNGSVIPLFKKQLREKNEITVTDPGMTRFLMSTKEAIGLVFKAVEQSQGGELFVMKMPAATVETIAKVMIRLFGNKKSRMKTIGIRPGEKRHEVLVSKNETPFAKTFSEKYFIVLPQIEDGVLRKRYSKKRAIGMEEFSSRNTYRLSMKELEEILRSERWLMEDE